MTTEAALTKDECYQLWTAVISQNSTLAKQVPAYAQAIVQAILQSPEAQALRNDAARYRWIASQRNAWSVIGDAYDLASEHEGAASLSESIDAAMEKQP